MLPRSIRTAAPVARAFRAQTQIRSGSGGPRYHQPTGNLFGEKPLAPGEKRKWEDWELISYVGLGGGILAMIVVYNYKPDTSIQTWALAEAKRRMEERGDLPKYVPSPTSTVPNK